MALVHFRGFMGGNCLADKMAVLALLVLILPAMSYASVQFTDAEMEAWFAKGDLDNDGSITSLEFEDWEPRLKSHCKTFIFEVT